MKHNAFKGRRKFCPLFERIGERKRVLYYQKEDLAPRHRMDGKTRERERERERANAREQVDIIV